MEDKRVRYKEQLGMDVGTAQNRLVRDMLFKLIVDCGVNECFQCGKAMSRDTFSLEHKEPWRNTTKASALFFDLDNIAFSHLSCNCAAAKRTSSPLSLEEREAIAKDTRKRKRAEYMLNRTEEERLRDKARRREQYLRTRT